MALTHLDSAKMDQIITEFFAKTLHIILESRSPYRSSRNFSGEQVFSSPSSSSSSSSSVRPRDKWFNLALRECPEAHVDHWRQSNLEPMVVDVVLIKRAHNWDPVEIYPKPDLVKNSSSKDLYFDYWNSDQEELGGERCEKIIERWVVQYEVRRSKDGGKCGKRSSSNILHALYKKSMLLLRSLYATVRLLPAYKIFRDLNLSGQISSYSLGHRVSSLVEPFTRREEAEMQRFGFAPVDTSCGRLCLSVLYRPILSDVSSETSTPMSPQFIPDYVGSPLADPLKRFPSLPASHGSPSSLPFSRRHSWSYDQYRASPPINCSPSPTHSEPYALATNPRSCRFPPPSVPPHPTEIHQAQRDNASFDEYYPSPTFSPSPSPSPPIYIPGSHMSKVLVRSESAPVNIPATKLPYSPALIKNQNLPPSPPPRVTRYGNLRADKNAGSVNAGAGDDKIFTLGRDDNRRHSGFKIPSSNSLQISYSRSSSHSFHDDYDDFTCPFDVDYDDFADEDARSQSFDQKGHLREPLEGGGLLPIRKSPGATVGALVDLLRKAPPLRQDESTSFSKATKPETWGGSVHDPCQIPKTTTVQDSAVASSGLIASKTTTDALEELRGYKEMKDLLLVQGGKSQALSSHSSTVEGMGRDTNCL